MRVVIALEGTLANDLAEELRSEGEQVSAVVQPSELREEHLVDADALVVTASTSTVTADLVAQCDRAAVRIVLVGAADTRRLARFGLAAPLPTDARPWDIVDALREDQPVAMAAPERGRPQVLTVWGPAGSPGRSTVAIQLATELARSLSSVALVDADTVAPSIALLLGLSDESPGVAAACRRAELGGLDRSELSRIASRVDTSVGQLDVLAGINRPSRWPELSASRVQATLTACRDWVDCTVVDVASSLESDEDFTSDLPVPERNAATIAALRSADHIIAVTSCDPLSISRFIRDHAELRRLVGTTPVTVVTNHLRPGPLGIDARGQVRRTLERFAGVDDVVFLPHDQRAADAALLHARPMADVTPRSAFLTGIRQLAAPFADQGRKASSTTGGSSRGSSRAARLLRRAPAARAESRRAGDPASAN